jgi:sugar lactone lactonase YvrE
MRTLPILGSLALIFASVSVAAATQAASGASPTRIWAVAGTGLPNRAPVCRNGGRCNPGDRATDMQGRTLLAVDSPGNMYFGVTLFGHRIAVAGLDGRLDRLIPLGMNVLRLAIGNHGELYFTGDDDSSYPGRVVWRWDPKTKRVTRVAGRRNDLQDNRSCGLEKLATCELDDHVAATRASLSYVTGLAVDPRGRLVIADSGHFAVRRVDLDGTITTIAGTGRFCASGKACSEPGGSARSTQLLPSSVAVGRDESIWFTSRNDLYRLGPRGRLRLVWTARTQHEVPPFALDRDSNAIVGYWPTGAHARLVRISPRGHVTSILDNNAHPDPRRPETLGDGQIASSAGIAHRVLRVATAGNSDIYFTDYSGEVRYVPSAGRTPARLALAVFAPRQARLRDPVRITFRTDAASTITIRVAPDGTPEALTKVPRTAGTLTWHPTANDRRLARGHTFALQVIATDARGRTATRIIP